ncbi:hypothetical protein HMN09_01120900 [Mycena chlorophos]|uniref:No apical meristem-associated C-terminal domain-containing protein n=1 Tax=Mycena chlorophos TaxID=658473 RepID=A0A8H6SBM8_MYCCL|nr:hypothetical protein HMN09_01120900 [Mycena chlorophos]
MKANFFIVRMRSRISLMRSAMCMPLQPVQSPFQHLFTMLMGFVGELSTTLIHAKIIPVRKSAAARSAAKPAPAKPKTGKRKKGDGSDVEVQEAPAPKKDKAPGPPMPEALQKDPFGNLGEDKTTSLFTFIKSDPVALAVLYPKSGQNVSTQNNGGKNASHVHFELFKKVFGPIDPIYDTYLTWLGGQTAKQRAVVGDKVKNRLKAVEKMAEVIDAKMNGTGDAKKDCPWYDDIKSFVAERPKKGNVTTGNSTSSDYLSVADNTGRGRKKSSPIPPSTTPAVASQSSVAPDTHENSDDEAGDAPISDDEKPKKKRAKPSPFQPASEPTVPAKQKGKQTEFSAMLEQESKMQRDQMKLAQKDAEAEIIRGRAAEKQAEARHLREKRKDKDADFKRGLELLGAEATYGREAMQQRFPHMYANMAPAGPSNTASMHSPAPSHQSLHMSVSSSPAPSQHGYVTVDQDGFPVVDGVNYGTGWNGSGSYNNAAGF